MIAVGSVLRFSTNVHADVLGKVLSNDDAFSRRPLRVQWHDAGGKHIERFNEQDFTNIRMH